MIYSGKFVNQGILQNYSLGVLDADNDKNNNIEIGKCHGMHIRHHAGFTLFELLVAAAIMLIIAGIGVPSFNSLIRDNRVREESNAMLGAIRMARSEAVKRGVFIWVNPVVDNGWQSGWEVRVDNGDDTFNAANDTLLRRFDAVSSEIHHAPARILLSSTGNLASPATVQTIRFKPAGCQDDEQRQLTLALSGRASLQRISCTS